MKLTMSGYMGKALITYISNSAEKQHLIVDSTLAAIRSPKCNNFGRSSKVLNDADWRGRVESFEERNTGITISSCSGTKFGLPSAKPFAV